MQRPEVQHTEDGSATLFVPDMDEHYHSIKGAYTEALHIYRDCAYQHATERFPTDGYPLRVLEIGFGTGLNTAVTAMAANAQHPVHYITLEKRPIAPSLVEELGYDSLVDAQLFAAIHAAPWEEPTAITPHFTLEKRCCDLLTTPLPSDIDIVYFDAFAPEKQPEMWSADIFARIYQAMSSHSVLTTYCAKGSIRRMLQATGFTVERLAGPIGGKREILRAIK
ncbi:MAG: tRNA (5-methylaminomethyl-2-thiouridine)(34)-methyltransferase MnmD [Bacteroidaceae bacterium]|nr:tRNA (5-methylaminomethyl-2-thiouridine)(34)-methyltransferase MnmD [Bacteroidaceae bacterium]